jgi:biopolymer transport protein ExbB
MHSESGLLGLWLQGDWVTRTVAMLLLGMSLASWMVILVKAISIQQATRQAGDVGNFWNANTVAEGIRHLEGGEGNPFHMLAVRGYEAHNHYLSKDRSPRLNDSLDLNDWVTRCLRSSMDDATARMQSGLAVLASVGSTAPFVGLFGTVWGIYHALLSIGSAGQATIDKVAGPIGEALIMTALGLAVAIPAVLGYNALVRGNKGVIQKLNRFTYDLHALLVTGGRLNSAESNASGSVLTLRKA